MKRKQLIWAFAATVILQLLIPAKMIYDSEITEKHGIVYKFKTVPVDPTDFLRGKYITLNYEAAVFETADTTFTGGDQVYVSLTKDKEGFATITAISHEEPEDTVDYVFADVAHSYGGRVHIEFPFERFYLNEHKAAAAEKAYAEHSGRKATPAYGLVAVKDGHAVLKDVYIENVPVIEYLKRQ
jgi:uncharacterized membrane-anchored protein